MDIVNKIISVWAGAWISLSLIGLELINRELINLRGVVLYVWIGAWGSLWLIAIYLRVVGITRVIEVPSEPEETESL